MLVVGAIVTGCEDDTTEVRTEPSDLLPRLERAASPAEQIALLDQLSAVAPEQLATVGAVTRPRADNRDTASEDPRPLVRQLATSGDAVVAAKAAELLAGWGDRAATAPLLRLLTHPDRVIRLSAAMALGTLADPNSMEGLGRATHDPEAMVRAQACLAIGRFAATPGAPGIAALGERLDDSAGSVRAAAARSLGEIGSPESGPRLMAHLDDRDPGVVIATAEALGAMRYRAAVPELITLLDRAEQPTRRAAAFALGRLGERQAVQPLISKLDRGEPMFRAEALRALKLLDDSSAIPAVIEVARDVDPILVAYVPYVLGKLYRPDWFDWFIGKLEDPNENVRAAIAFSLGLAGEQRATTRLVAALKDARPTARLNAARALGLLGAVDARPRLEALALDDPFFRVQDAANIAIEMTHVSTDDVVDRLLRVLEHDQRKVRRSAAVLLGGIEDPKALPALRHAARDDSDELVRDFAAAAVRRMMDSEAVPAVAEIGETP
jgi:HEAT repeat protein